MPDGGLSKIATASIIMGPSFTTTTSVLQVCETSTFPTQPDHHRPSLSSQPRQEYLTSTENMMSPGVTLGTLYIVGERGHPLTAGYLANGAAPYVRQLHTKWKIQITGPCQRTKNLSLRSIGRIKRMGGLCKVCWLRHGGLPAPRQLVESVLGRSLWRFEFSAFESDEDRQKSPWTSNMTHFVNGTRQ